MIGTWTAPIGDGRSADEMMVAFDRGRAVRVLVMPALFEEANKLRRFTVETMRRLDELGVDSFLPDLPGQNESVAPLESQTLESWRMAARNASALKKATHVLTFRAGVLIAPEGLPGWSYAPQSGAKLLRPMIRARIIAAREAGRIENAEALKEIGRESGLELAGWPIGPEMFRELEGSGDTGDVTLQNISQSELGGAGLWLRAEPGEAPEQSEELARIVSGARNQD